MATTLRVECYAGYRADERPLRFSWRGDTGDERFLEVKGILSQWSEPEFRCFKIRADDDRVYVLRHHAVEDIWTLHLRQKRRALRP